VLSALALAGTLRFVPESADPDAARLDLGGAAIAVFALVALVFSVIEAPTHGWLAARTVIGLSVAVALLIAFVIWELHQRNPLLDPRVFRERTLTAGTMSILVQFFSFYGYTFIILQYLQLVRGATPLLAALEVLPLAATMMPTSRMAPRLAARFGPRRVCAGGLILVAAGLAIVAQLDAGSSYWLLAAGLVVLGIGMGAAMTPGHHRDHRGAPTCPAGSRLRAQRSVPRGRRRDRNRGDWKHPHLDLQQPRQRQPTRRPGSGQG
jgi:hypothetical protein